MFVQIDRRTLFLKMVEREVFSLKPKHQCRLPQWEECVYGAQSWKKKEDCYVNPCLSQLKDELLF